MTTTTLDTLQVAKDLQAATFSEQQAEALARLLRARQEADLSQMATKADLVLLEHRLLAKMGGMLAVAVGILAALDAILP